MEEATDALVGRVADIGDVAPLKHVMVFRR